MTASREQLMSLGLLRPKGERQIRTLANQEGWSEDARDAEDRTPAEAGLHRPRLLSRDESNQSYKVRRRLGKQAPQQPPDVLPPAPVLPPPPPEPPVSRGRSGDPRELPHPDTPALDRVRAAEDHVLGVMAAQPLRRWYPNVHTDLVELCGRDFTREEILDAVRRLHAAAALTCWAQYGNAYSLPTPEDLAAHERQRVRAQQRRARLKPFRSTWDSGRCPTCRPHPATPTVVCVACHADCCAHRAVAYAGRVWCKRCYTLIPTDELVARLEAGGLPASGPGSAPSSGERSG